VKTTTERLIALEWERGDRSMIDAADSYRASWDDSLESYLKDKRNTGWLGAILSTSF
jgi:hypothetical protein